MPIPFSEVTNTVAPGFITPPQKNPKTGRPDTIPNSAVNAEVVSSPTAADNVQAEKDQKTTERQAQFRHQIDAAKGSGRKRKSRKTKRKSRKSRRTRRRS